MKGGSAQAKRRPPAKLITRKRQSEFWRSSAFSSLFSETPAEGSGGPEGPLLKNLFKIIAPYV
jgi:hypothetical protein